MQASRCCSFTIPRWSLPIRLQTLVAHFIHFCIKGLLFFRLKMRATLKRDEGNPKSSIRTQLTRCIECKLVEAWGRKQWNH